AIAAMEYVKSLKWTYDCLTADPLSENWATGHASIGTGTAAMEIAANDAVAEPTQTNGLAVDKLALAPLPAGPNGDQYMLSGGTPYMFAGNATPDELNAALDFLELMGRSPFMTDEVYAGMELDAANRVERGVPVLARFPIWTNPEFGEADQKITEEYSNVDMNLFNDYFAAALKPGMLRMEYPNAQLVYAELAKVLQAVVSDENANVPELMEKANANTQILLDGGELAG
ncbi:MAG: sugar ABC transporter substrate-binding protein, partial [Acetanaerobacterium sp.]